MTKMEDKPPPHPSSSWVPVALGSQPLPHFVIIVVIVVVLKFGHLPIVSVNKLDLIFFKAWENLY